MIFGRSESMTYLLRIDAAMSDLLFRLQAVERVNSALFKSHGERIAGLEEDVLELRKSHGERIAGLEEDVLELRNMIDTRTQVRR